MAILQNLSRIHQYLVDIVTLAPRARQLLGDLDSSVGEIHTRYKHKIFSLKLLDIELQKEIDSGWSLHTCQFMNANPIEQGENTPVFCIFSKT